MANNLPLLTWTKNVFTISDASTTFSVVDEIYDWFNAGNSTHWEVSETWTVGGDLMFILQPKNQAGNTPNMRIGMFTTDTSGTTPNSVNCVGSANQQYAYIFCTDDGSSGYDNDPIGGEIYTSSDWTKGCICFSQSTTVNECMVLESEEGIAIAVYRNDGIIAFSGISGALGHKSDGNTRRYLSAGSGATTMIAAWCSSTSNVASPLTSYQGLASSAGSIGILWDEANQSGLNSYRSAVYSQQDARSSDLKSAVNSTINIHNAETDAYACSMRQIYVGAKSPMGRGATVNGELKGYALSAAGPTSTTLTDALYFLDL